MCGVVLPCSTETLLAAYLVLQALPLPPSASPPLVLGAAGCLNPPARPLPRGLAC